MDVMQQLDRCVESVRCHTDFIPRIGLILGSGLGGFADAVEAEAILPYSEIAGFPISTAPGHAGRFVFGHVSGVPVVVMQGRVHYYEGYPMHDVVLPTRLMAALGVKALLLTNAAGGINPDFTPGDLMILDDHISCFVPSPLIGPHDERLGLRFPDMSAVYDRELCAALEQAGNQTGVALRRGVYLQLTGPQFETPAEIRALRLLGADAVGMSTAVEAIAARHMDVRVCGVSCISNMAAGMGATLLTAEDVNETADRVASSFRALLTAAIPAIARELGKEG